MITLDAYEEEFKRKMLNYIMVSYTIGLILGFVAGILI